jgi:AcrR family transcriptional regulator
VATVDEIAQTAGNSKGAFYFHFDSKEEIFLELLRTYVIPDKDPDSADVEELGAGVRERELLEPLLLEFWAHAARNERIRDDLRALYRSRIESFVGPAEADEEHSGAMREIAQVITAVEDGLILQHILGVGATDNRVMLDRLRRVMKSDADNQTAHEAHTTAGRSLRKANRG